MRLSDLRPGQAADVVAITGQNTGRLMKLAALGLAPGSHVRLQQRLPAFVLWVGETQLSLDEEVAQAIIVEVKGVERG